MVKSKNGSHSFMVLLSGASTIMTRRNVLKSIMPNRAIIWINNLKEIFLIKSIHAAIQEQGLSQLMNKLETIVPDITHQYSTFEIYSDYYKAKVRGQHTFQIHLVNKALKLISGVNDNFLIVDIGDSAGTHICYLRSIHNNQNTKFLSVNIDEMAVNKIRKKGLEAICCRAEDLSSYSLNADIFLSFEMLEHLMNPAQFLYDLSTKTNCKALVITVPYVINSRLGLYHIRNQERKNVTPENTHIFELSPNNWKLLFMHSGWSVAYEKIYLQYPTKSPLRLMKWFWKKYDFEGFYGVVLLRDNSWSKLYDGW
ncbi:MAG: hypothetical protein KAS04_06825 [Candidatus Aenigmarchaeota archaeon]|nr:hypothetical protein [Candidatus Aenigmarchaeota archaeon]